MSTPNQLTNPAVSASGEVDSLLIEKFTGKVHEAYLKGENIMSYFDLNEVKGTNMVSNKYFGETEVQVLAPGQSPESTDVDFDKNALVVDTSIIVRNTMAQIHEAQNDIEGVKSKLASNQSKKLKQLEDYMLIQQLCFGGMTNFKTRDGVTGGRAKPRVSGHGFSVRVLADMDKLSLSPNYLMGSIEFAIEQQIEQEVDINDLVIIMPWKFFNILRDAERVVNTKYTTSSGATVDGFTLKSYNLPVKPSNRFPTAAQVAATKEGTHHKLSNKNNNFRYDPIEGMDDIVAVIHNSEALLVGRTIELQSEIFRDSKDKTYYIDTYMAEGAIPDRWESVSIVQGMAIDDAKDDAALVPRAKRKAQITTDFNLSAGQTPPAAPTAMGAYSAAINPKEFADAVAASVAAIVKPAALKDEVTK